MERKQKQGCAFPGCPAQAVLTEMIPDPNGLPRMLRPGDEFPQRPRLRAWVCEMNPKRHVEVVGWGFRPVKDCTAPGCNGVMIHSKKARLSAPDDLRKLPGKPYAMLSEHAGFLCMKDESHVELETAVIEDERRSPKRTPQRNQSRERVMPIRAKDDSDFKALLETLLHELSDAAIHFRLWRELLDAAQNTYAREMSQSWTFWSLTIQAHVDIAVSRLCKAYDVNRDSLNLRTFLNLIKEQPDVFSAERFRQRLQGNPHVESLAATSRLPDMATLEKDLEFVSVGLNPMVTRLVAWRDKYVSHRDPRCVVGDKQLEPLPFADIEALIREGMRIANHYSHLFAASVTSSSIIGHDDYLSVLKAVREHLEHQEAEFQREVAKYALPATEPEPTT